MRKRFQRLLAGIMTAVLTLSTYEPLANKGETAYADADGTIHANRPGKAKLTAKINGKTIKITVVVG